MYSFIGYIIFALLSVCLLVFFYFVIRKEKKDMQKWVEKEKIKQKEWEKNIFHKISEI